MVEFRGIKPRDTHDSKFIEISCGPNIGGLVILNFLLHALYKTSRQLMDKKRGVMPVLDETKSVTKVMIDVLTGSMQESCC